MSLVYINRRTALAGGAAALTVPLLSSRDAEAANVVPSALWSNYFYGDAAAGWGAGNTRLNAPEAVSYFYTCEMSGYISALRVVFEKGPGGYSGSAGGGGPYDVQIRSDASGLPGSTVYATSNNSTTSPPFSTFGTKSNWVVQFNFMLNRYYNAGDKVHFVIRNKISSGHSTNYLSVNNFHSSRFWTPPDTASSPAWTRNPYFHTNGTSLTTLHRMYLVDKGAGTGPWQQDWSKLPTMEVDFKASSSATAVTKGQGVIFTWNGSLPNDYVPLSNVNSTTLTFKPTQVTQREIGGTDVFTKLIRNTSWNGDVYLDLSGPLNADKTTNSVRYYFTDITYAASLTDPETTDPQLPIIGWNKAYNASKPGPFYLWSGSTYTLKWSSVSGSSAYIRPHDMSSVPADSDSAGLPGVISAGFAGKTSFKSQMVNGTYTVGGTTATFFNNQPTRTSLPFLFRVRA